MRKILFIGLVVTAVVLVSGCYGPTTSPNATVQPTGGTPSEVVTPVTTPEETYVTPVMTATSVGISTVTETPYATSTWMVTPNVTGTSYATTPAVTTAGTTTTGTTTGTAAISPTVVTVNAVDITSTGFNPAIISVQTGTTVTWTNRDNTTHEVKGSGFDSGSIDAGQTFTRTFSQSGSYDYNDPGHSNMTGTVIVT